MNNTIRSNVIVAAMLKRARARASHGTAAARPDGRTRRQERHARTDRPAEDAPVLRAAAVTTTTEPNAYLRRTGTLTRDVRPPPVPFFLQDGLPPLPRLRRRPRRRRRRVRVTSSLSVVTDDGTAC